MRFLSFFRIFEFQGINVCIFLSSGINRPNIKLATTIPTCFAKNQNSSARFHVRSLDSFNLNETVNSV